MNDLCISSHITSLPELLDEVVRRINNDDTNSAMTLLFSGLADVRSSQTQENWNQSVLVGQSHSLCSILRQCPLTSHAFVRPRGYPGDAALLDFIYFGDDEALELPNGTTEVGRAIFRWLIQANAAKAVRARKQFISGVIAEKITIQHLRVLSVAAGHARELGELPTSTAQRHLNFLALDQDAASLSQASHSLSLRGLQIRSICRSALDLLKHGVVNESFDLIYSLGLFDYLPDRLAERLTSALFDRVEPGGQLIIANFAPNLLDQGFMEMYLRWELIYRTEPQMRQLMRRLRVDPMCAVDIHPIADGLIWVLSLTKVNDLVATD